MKLGLVFTINAFVAGVYGVAFVVAPGPLLAGYAVTLNPGTEVLSRIIDS